MLFSSLFSRLFLKPVLLALVSHEYRIRLSDYEEKFVSSSRENLLLQHVTTPIHDNNINHVLNLIITS